MLKLLRVSWVSRSLLHLHIWQPAQSNLRLHSLGRSEFQKVVCMHKSKSLRNHPNGRVRAGVRMGIFHKGYKYKESFFQSIDMYLGQRRACHVLETRHSICIQTLQLQ